MDIRKMVFDGVTYNVLTDEELKNFCEEYALKKELESIHEQVENGTMACVDFDTFVKERKEKYGL